MLGVFKALWTSDHPRFEGSFYKFDDVGFQPKPIQKPHLPIWVGGGVNLAVFRRVVKLGDGWHASSKTPKQIREALPQLRAVAEAAGRPFESIEVSTRVSLRNLTVSNSRQQIVDQLAEFKALGLSHLLLDFRSDSLPEMLEILDFVASEIRPAVDAT
jgi:alkanesulfonate monooxygenase SsuD/methylene tetrahydromethanopterin reductase-like flavin-dependent oxidoreductase (luciferase family)